MSGHCWTFGRNPDYIGKNCICTNNGCPATQFLNLIHNNIDIKQFYGHQLLDLYYNSNRYPYIILQQQIEYYMGLHRKEINNFSDKIFVLQLDIYSRPRSVFQYKNPDTEFYFTFSFNDGNH